MVDTRINRCVTENRQSTHDCVLPCWLMTHSKTLKMPALKLKMVHFVLAIFASYAFGANAIAGGFDTYGDQQRLENQVIITSGNVSTRSSVSNTSNYSMDLSYFDRQKQTVFEIGRFCFKISDSFEDISGKAGLLLVDQFSNTSIAVITESISSIKIKFISVIVYDCISLTMQESNRYQKQLQQDLEMLKQQRAILDQMMKSQRATSKKAP